MTAFPPAWLPPPSSPALSHDEVHVWRASSELSSEQVAALAQTLSRDERMRTEQFYFARDRRRFIVGRGLLRAILSRCLGAAPHDLRFEYSPHGKPALADASGPHALRFNLSHSNGLILYTIAYHREVGVDLEHIRPVADLEKIVARYFSARENAALRALAQSEKLAAFFNCWTRKEAYLKAIGDGLAQPLDTFEVALAPGEAAELRWVAGRPQETARWSLHALTPAPGYAAALAVEGHDLRLTCWQWPEA